MSFKRFVLVSAVVSTALVLGTAAQAKKFSLTGGGGQVHIGNGLALPVQPSLTYLTSPNDFPPLLVPPVPGAIISGTTGNPLLVATDGKQAYQNKLTIPAGVLSKSAAQNTVGLRFSNPTLFAVGTNVKYTWPVAPAVFSQAALAASPAVITFPIGTVIASMTYSNSLPTRFGGPARFMLSSGGASGLIAAPITIYAKINATTPACTHPAFGGTDAGCVAGLFRALPTGPQAVGGPASITVTTPGGPVPAPNIAVLKMGLTPLGTISLAVAAAATPLPDNKATSQAGPWTTGRIVIKNGAAAGAAETFTISGKDSRTVGGRGTIQLVAGSVSDRLTTGPNANRGWLELQLGHAFPGDVPAMSPAALAAAGGLILIAGGYAARRRMTS
jgi:hypothetical protein